MRVGHLEIFVSEPGRAREFYEGVLGFEVFAVQGDGKFIWLTDGRVELLLRPGRVAGAAASYDRAPAAICLYTDDLAAAMARLRERGLEFRGHDGSPCCPTFADPDGNWFQLVDPGDHQG